MMAAKKLSENFLFRNKPFIVICGCTGTGKTKLSIQLAEWLIQSKGKRVEIINADAMQLYKNLNIITNKATEQEMKNIKHHLIGYLNSDCITNTVIDYRNKAVKLIDKLLQEDIIPILVGGTHYYIHAVLSDILIDTEPTLVNEKKRKSLHNEDDSNVFKLIKECHEKNMDLNVFLHDSSISTQEFYEQLQRVDMQSAQKIHPNDRRKLVRALQVYYTFGVTQSALLDEKNRNLQESKHEIPNGNSSKTGVRYKNACMFVMSSEQEVLNKRLDDRVDEMIEKGLVKEIEEFKTEFELHNPETSFKEYSRDFEFGIFQSIGFKEFDEYFAFIKNKNEQSQAQYEDSKQKLFDKCVENMKLSTRRYAKTQLKWINNKFSKEYKNSIKLHSVDTSDLLNWDENIFGNSKKIFENYLNEFEKNPNVNLNEQDEDNNQPNESVFEYNKCEICDKVFVNKFQWQCHLNGARHKKRVNNIKKKEKNIQNKPSNLT